MPLFDIFGPIPEDKSLDVALARIESQENLLSPFVDDMFALADQRIEQQESTLREVYQPITRPLIREVRRREQELERLQEGIGNLLPVPESVEVVTPTPSVEPGPIKEPILDIPEPIPVPLPIPIPAPAQPVPVPFPITSPVEPPRRIIPIEPIPVPEPPRVIGPPLVITPPTPCPPTKVVVPPCPDVKIPPCPPSPPCPPPAPITIIVPPGQPGIAPAPIVISPSPPCPPTKVVVPPCPEVKIPPCPTIPPCPPCPPGQGGKLGARVKLRTDGVIEFEFDLPGDGWVYETFTDLQETLSEVWENIKREKNKGVS